MNVLGEFEARESQIAAPVTQALRYLGERAILAYASVGLYHNTLSRFVPSILREGLHADSPDAVPDPADEEFATELFYEKGYRYPASERQFDILIRGKRGDREPGVFFYPLHEPAEEYRAGYGVPERLHLLALEMGCVMLHESGPYTPAERDRARQIFTKYRDFIHGTENSHVSVIRANPFNPNIINNRLQGLPELTEKNDREELIQYLGVLGFNLFEGIYVPGPIEAADLEDTGAQLPILSSLNENKLKPSQSRFFYIPPHLQRTQQ